MAAIMNGDVQFISTAASDVLVARARGDRMFSVGIFPASLEWHIATNNKWLESRGLTKAQVAKDDRRAKNSSAQRNYHRRGNGRRGPGAGGSLSAAAKQSKTGRGRALCRGGRRLSARQRAQETARST